MTKYKPDSGRICRTTKNASNINKKKRVTTFFVLKSCSDSKSEEISLQRFTIDVKKTLETQG